MFGCWALRRGQFRNFKLFHFGYFCSFSSFFYFTPCFPWLWAPSNLWLLLLGALEMTVSQFWASSLWLLSLIFGFCKVGEREAAGFVRFWVKNDLFSAQNFHFAHFFHLFTFTRPQYVLSCHLKYVPCVRIVVTMNLRPCNLETMVVH